MLGCSPEISEWSSVVCKFAGCEYHVAHLPLSHLCSVELSSCAHVLELTRTKQGPFTLEEHALPEDRWTIDDIAQSLEHCTSLLPDELAFKKPKSEKSSDQALSYEYITLSETKREEDEIKTL